MWSYLKSLHWKWVKYGNDFDRLKNILTLIQVEFCETVNTVCLDFSSVQSVMVLSMVFGKDYGFFSFVNVYCAY